MRTRSRRAQLSMSGPTMNRQVRHPDGCRITWLGSDVVVCKSGVPIVRQLALNLHNARVEGVQMRHEGCNRMCSLRQDNPRNLLYSNAFHSKPLPRQHFRRAVCKVTGRGDLRRGSKILGCGLFPSSLGGISNKTAGQSRFRRPTVTKHGRLMKGYPTMPATVIGESIGSPTTPTSSTSKATPTGYATVTSAASPQPTPRPTSHQEPWRGQFSNAVRGFGFTCR